MVAYVGINSVLPSSNSWTAATATVALVIEEILAKPSCNCTKRPTSAEVNKLADAVIFTLPVLPLARRVVVVVLGSNIAPRFKTTSLIVQAVWLVLVNFLGGWDG